MKYKVVTQKFKHKTNTTCQSPKDQISLLSTQTFT